MVRKRVGKLTHVGLTGYLASNIGVGQDRSVKSQPTTKDPASALPQYAILAPSSLPQLQLINQTGLLTYKPAENSSRVEEVKEEAKEEAKEKEKPSDEGKKDKEDPPKSDETPVPETAEAPPTGQEPTTKPIIQQVCAGCGKIRSASYHYRLQQNAGSDAPPNFCRKCINEITSSEENDDDDAVEGRRFLERRQRNQLKLRLESLKQGAGSSASSEDSLPQGRSTQRRESSHKRRGPGRRIQVLISDGEDDDKASGVMIMRGQGQGLVRRNDHHHSNVEGFQSQPSRKSPTRSRSSSTEDRAFPGRTAGRRHVTKHEKRRKPSDGYYTTDAERRLAAHPIPYRYGHFHEVEQPVIEGRSGRLPFIRRRSYSMHEKGMSYEQRSPEYHRRYQDTRHHAEEFNEERYTGDRRPLSPPIRRVRISGRLRERLIYDPRDEEDRYWDSDVAEVGDYPDRVRFRQEEDVFRSRHEEARWDPPEVYPTGSPRGRGRRRYVAPNDNHDNPRRPIISEEETYHSPSDDNSSTRTQRRYTRLARAPSPPRPVPPSATSTTRPRYIARHAHVDEDDEEITRALRDARLQGRGRREERKWERERSRSPSLLTSAWGAGRRGSRGGQW